LDEESETVDAIESVAKLTFAPPVAPESSIRVIVPTPPPVVRFAVSLSLGGPLEGAAGTKGLKTGALGFVSNIVIGVASTAPAYSLAVSLGLVVAAVGIFSPAIMWVAFLPMLAIAFAYYYMNRADQGGNAQYLGPDLFYDDLFCLAAEKRYVSCERIVPTGDFLKEGSIHTLRLNRLMVDGVVDAYRAALAARGRS